MLYYYMVYYLILSEATVLGKNEQHMTSIGGQAVIEGVMMRGPSKTAIAIRKPDGDIDIDVKENNLLVAKWKLAKIPIVRGVVAFFDSIVTGVKATMHSAEFVDIEDDEDAKPSKIDAFLEKHFGDSMISIVMWISVLLSLVLGIGLFMLLPTVIAGGVKTALWRCRRCFREKALRRRFRLYLQTILCSI